MAAHTVTQLIDAKVTGGAIEEIPPPQPGGGRDAARAALDEAGGMAEPHVIVYPPSETGGRRVRIDGRLIGTAYSLHELTVFLQNEGLTGWDELDVAESDLIEWHEGGPELWKRL